jgi:peptidoglycan/LPS O-acetylase OafA/YrhL
MTATSAMATDTAAAKRTKPHFVVLDGLRGVAAVGVVIFHFMEMVIWNYSKLWIGHGFLAVERVERLCRFSGDLSYPLYMTHYSVIWIWGDYAEKHKLALRGMGIPVVCGVITMVAFAWLVMMIYDKPVRAYLRAKW